MRFWINCLNKDHVLAGVAGGFAQAAPGKADPLRKVSKGDVIVFYSEGTLFRAGQLLQAFTAIGRVAGDAPFQTKVTEKFNPWRRRIEFLDGQEAPILPLVPELSFIADKTNWAAALKGDLFEIGETDGSTIAAAMKVALG